VILIDAVYICQYGGKSLLDLLIDQFEKEVTPANFVFLIDERIKESYIERKFQKTTIVFLRGSEIVRYKYYFKNRYKYKKVFCFANIPPPIRLECPVMTYFQNVLLFDSKLQNLFSVKERVLFALKGYLIKHRKGNTDTWIVQTNPVRDLLQSNLKVNVEQIKVFSFFNEDIPKHITETDKKDNAFFYPASGVSLKNHDRLLKAWSNLFRKGLIKHELHLTVKNETNPGLYSEIIKLQKKGIPIINHGYLSISEVYTLYSKIKFIIHPSLGESFGLVLIEAIMNRCILLAPDLPYVKAIVQPNYFFDAENISSIEESIFEAISGKNCFTSQVLVRNELEVLVKSIIS
jgi:hypothetical protein